MSRDTPSPSVMDFMKEIVAREARNRFGHLLDTVWSAPVRLTKSGCNHRSPPRREQRRSRDGRRGAAPVGRN